MISDNEILKKIQKHKYEKITKPSYYDKIKRTVIIIDLMKDKKTSFKFVSLDENSDILGEREYTFTLDEEKIDSIIGQLEDVKARLKR